MSSYSFFCLCISIYVCMYSISYLLIKSTINSSDTLCRTLSSQNYSVNYCFFHSPFSPFLDHKVMVLNYKEHITSIVMKLITNCLIQRVGTAVYLIAAVVANYYWTEIISKIISTIVDGMTSYYHCISRLISMKWKHLLIVLPDYPKY